MGKAVIRMIDQKYNHTGVEVISVKNYILYEPLPYAFVRWEAK